MWELCWTKWHSGRFLSSGSALFSKSRYSSSSTGWSYQQEERAKPGKLEINQCLPEDWEHREENRFSIFSALRKTSGISWEFSAVYFCCFPPPVINLASHYTPYYYLHIHVLPPAHPRLPNDLTVNYGRSVLPRVKNIQFIEGNVS